MTFLGSVNFLPLGLMYNENDNGSFLVAWRIGYHVRCQFCVGTESVGPDVVIVLFWVFISPGHSVGVGEHQRLFRVIGLQWVSQGLDCVRPAEKQGYR